MNVGIHYFAQVRRAAGVESETLAVPADAGLGAALDQAVTRHGPEFAALVRDETGRIRSSLIVLVNGVPASSEEASPLKEGDVVSLLSAVAGG